MTGLKKRPYKKYRTAHRKYSYAKFYKQPSFKLNVIKKVLTIDGSLKMNGSAPISTCFFLTSQGGTTVTNPFISLANAIAGHPMFVNYIFPSSNPTYGFKAMKISGFRVTVSMFQGSITNNNVTASPLYPTYITYFPTLPYATSIPVSDIYNDNKMVIHFNSGLKQVKYFKTPSLEFGTSPCVTNQWTDITSYVNNNVTMTGVLAVTDSVNYPTELANTVVGSITIDIYCYLRDYL